MISPQRQSGPFGPRSSIPSTRTPGPTSAGRSISVSGTPGPMDGAADVGDRPAAVVVGVTLAGGRPP